MAVTTLAAWQTCSFHFREAPSRSPGLPRVRAPGPSAPEPARAPDSDAPRVPASWLRALPAIDGAGIVLGVLVPAIGLLGSVADAVRVPLLLASWGALALRITVSDRDAADPHVAVV